MNFKTLTINSIHQRSTKDKIELAKMTSYLTVTSGSSGHCIRLNLIRLLRMPRIRIRLHCISHLVSLTCTSYRIWLRHLQRQKSKKKYATVYRQSNWNTMKELGDTKWLDKVLDDIEFWIEPTRKCFTVEVISLEHKMKNNLADI